MYQGLRSNNRHRLQVDKTLEPRLSTSGALHSTGETWRPLP